jgi:hypothetical protein
LAVLIPEVPKKCPNGERIVYERLGRELPADWVVLHSLNLPRHASKIWGEADIVVLSTLGVFALEVKGGKVSCRDGIWCYEGPDFSTYTKKEDPWTQSETAMMAVKKALCDANPAFSDTLFGYGVVMPFTRFDANGVEFLPEVLLDKRTFRQEIGQYLGRVHRHWQQEYLRKHRREYRGLAPHQIGQARQILRPDLETTLSVGGYLTGTESQLLALTNTQIKVSRRLATNPRSVVSGPAGTGKSLLAVDRARQLAANGKRVLLLCFNKLLAGHVRRSVTEQGVTNLDVRHAHGLYSEIISAAGMQSAEEELEADDPSYFAIRLPQLACDAILEKGIDPWDVLIVDEAQDLLTPAHLDVFDLLVVGGIDHGCWSFFLDPQQNLYSSDVQLAVEGRLATAYPVQDRLEDNCRNTRQVAVQASITSGLDLAMTNAPDGLTCDNVYYGSRADGVAKLEELVDRLLQGDVRPHDLIVLSTRRRENSLVADVATLSGRPLIDVGDDARVVEGAIAFSTMHGFKGLERMAVIAIDMAEIGEPQYSMLHYAGLSRARCVLHSLVPESATGRYDRQAVAYGKRVEGRPV